MNRMQGLRHERAMARKAVLDRVFARLSDAAMRAGLLLVPFGSYAGDRVHGGSDLDVAVPGAVSDEDRRFLLREAGRLQAEAGIGVDLVFESESPEFFREVTTVYGIPIRSSRGTIAMRCENWEEGRFTVVGPDNLERPLRSLLWYDGPRIFTFPHDGEDRLFTCAEETDEALIYFGASPSAEMVEKLCRNKSPLIEGYRTGPFFRMSWDHGSAWPTEIREVEVFPKEYLQDPDVFLVFDPRGKQENEAPQS